MKPEELERQYSAGQLILERGSETRDLFVVRSGNVLIDRDDGGEPRLIGPGQLFGELGAVLGAPSPYRAEADDEVTLLALAPDLVNRLCSESREFAMRFVLHVASELSGSQGSRGPLAGIDQGLAQGFRKLVPVLFECSRSDESPAPVDGKLKDLAERAGLSILDAYFCIQRLLESRTLRLVDDQLAIVEPDHLEDLRGP